MNLYYATRKKLFYQIKKLFLYFQKKFQSLLVESKEIEIFPKFGHLFIDYKNFQHLLRFDSFFNLTFYKINIFKVIIKKEGPARPAPPQQRAQTPSLKPAKTTLLSQRPQSSMDFTKNNKLDLFSDVSNDPFQNNINDLKVSAANGNNSSRCKTLFLDPT